MAEEKVTITNVVPIADSDQFRVHFSLGEVRGSVLARDKEDAINKISAEIPELQGRLDRENELKALIGQTVAVEPKKPRRGRAERDEPSEE